MSFLGLSMTDPNLRRLLDIANRRNPSNSLNHFIIKDKPQRINKKEEDRLPLFLIERDFNELGLNTIWIEDFKEIPDILTRIGTSYAYLVLLKPRFVVRSYFSNGSH